MNRMMIRAVLLGVLSVAPWPGFAQSPSEPTLNASGDAWDDPATHDTLQAMTNASTWYHPDLFGLTVGMRRYGHRQFESALHYFEIGALYADKLSQLSIGLMHLNGEGVPKDPVSAYAWIDLASERNYPAFVATRDRIKATLTPQQLDQAMALHKVLYERYGDAVAKARMTWELRQGQMQFTGSITGFDFGISTLPMRDCGPALRIGGRTVPQAGCLGPSFWAKENWQPELYFAARDQEWKASVSVGPVEEPGAAKEPGEPAAESPAADSGRQ